MTAYAAHCKKCGSGKIVSYDTIIASASIYCFYQEPDGSLTPDFTGDTDVSWDTQTAYDEAKPYQCEGCWELLGECDLTLEEIKE